MKKITYTVACAFAMLASSNAIAQQGFGTNRPHKSAAVHIESPNKGLLIPRVALKSDTDNTTIVDPALSLLVYNTSSLGGLRPGYYYNSVEVNQTATPAIGPKWVPFLDASNNTVTAENGLTKVGNAIRLGGNIIDDTKITIDTGKKIMIQGLTQVTSMTDQVIAVGHYQSGHVQVATPKQIVTAGIENDLKLDIYPTGSNNQIVLTSTVNGDAAPVDLKPAIQAGQVKYEVVSADKSVVVTPDNTNPDFIKYDLKVTNTNASIEVGNGIKKDANDNNRVVLGGDLTQDTTIHTQGKKVMIQGLSTVTDMTNQMIAVGDAGTGLLKVASPKQIVDAGISVKNGISIDATDGAVKLGGKLTEKTEIDTDGKELQLKGITAANLDESIVLMQNTKTNAIHSTLPGALVGVGLKNGSGTTVEVSVNAAKSAVHLGGKLTQNAVIETTKANGTVPAYTLAIKGLEDSTAEEKLLVTVDETTGVLTKTKLSTSYAVTDVTVASYTVLASDETLLVDTKTQSIEVKIPAATTANKGKRYYIKSNGNNQTHTHVLKISSTSAIDGSTDPIESSSPYQSWLLQSNGSEWFVIGY